jgi:hypothetical protein
MILREVSNSSHSSASAGSADPGTYLPLQSATQRHYDAIGFIEVMACPCVTLPYFTLTAGFYLTFAVQT